MTDFSELHTRIQADCQGPSTPNVDQAINAALRDFCRLTRAWSVDLDPVDVVAGTAEYDLTLPEATELWGILRAVYVPDPDPTLRAVSIRWLDANWPGWEYAEGNRPTHFLRPSSASVRLICKPTEDVTGGLEVKAALLPTVAAREMDDDLYVEHHEAIIFGALARLRLQSGRPWFDPQRASVDAAAYGEAVRKAKLRAFKERVGHPMIAVSNGQYFAES